MRTEMINLDSK